MTNSIFTDIYSIETVFNRNLTIPDYQRPYRWNKNQVYQLLNDLLHHFNQEKKYRLGSVVIHKNNDKYGIVDGQQRTITLALLLNHLGETEKVANFLDSKVEKLSQKSILINNQIISDFCENHRLKTTNFSSYVLKECEMVYIELSDLEEAFQFFDSQNARGKSLAPYDLLKAYHLREMREERFDVVHSSVENWEGAIEPKDEESATLNLLMNNTLFKLRAWKHKEDAEHFRNNDIKYFKGVNKDHKYPYLRQLQPLQDSFQIHQPLINGRYFFDYIEYYRKHYDYLFHSKSGRLNQIILDGKRCLDFLNTYKGSHRQGDVYLSILFKCTVLYYYDKFGEEQLNEAVILIFKWVYKTRLEQFRILYATIFNKVMNENFIKTIEFALEPKDVFLYTISPIRKSEKIVSNIQELESMLRNMGVKRDE